MTTLRDAFWVLAIGIIGTYAFFLALGAFAVDDVLPVTIVVGVLLVLWIGHAWTGRAGAGGTRDPRSISARERRGF